MASSKEEFPPVGDSPRTLALLDIAEGKPEVAEKRLATPAEYMETQKENEDATAYYDLLSLALLAQNKPAEALKTVQHAHSLLPSHSSGQVPIHLKMTEALVNAAGQPRDQKAVSDALASLRAVVAECKKRHLLGLEFQARLTEGTILMQSGHTRDAKAVAVSLETDARARGFELIARQASELSQPIH